MQIRPVGRRAASSLVLVLLALCPPLARAQTVPAADGHGEEAYVIEQARSRWRYENDGTGTRHLFMRARTQSEAGVQQFGQLVFGYNAASERLDITFVRVRKPDGSTIETPASGVQDLSSPVERVAPIYTDFRQKHVTVQGLRPGDTIEFDIVTTVHSALAPGQFWGEHIFNTHAIVLDEQFEIDVPSRKRITLKTKPGFDPKVQEAGGRTVYRWAQSNLKRKAEESDSDEKDDSQKAADEPEVAPVRLTTFESWEQVGRWYAALEGPQRQPTPEIRARAAQLTAGKTTDMEKLAALYEFVAAQFRYVSLSLGMGRYQPRPAAEVLREQYGDCKDKHTLLASLIEAAGLRASAALINSTVKLDPDFPSPSQFDHVITRTRAGGEDVWVDSTTEVAPFRLLAPTLRKKLALVVEAGGAPHLEETPANPPMKSFLLQEIDGTLAESGKLTARLKIALRGDLELGLRTAFRSVPRADWKQIADRIATIGDKQGEVTNLEVTDPGALRDPFRLEFDVTFEDFVAWDDGKATVPLPFSGAAPSGEQTGDSGPIRLGAAPSEVSYKLRLTLPAGVTLRPPVPVSVTRDYADYRATYALDGSTFVGSRIFTSSQSELPAERKEDHDALLRVMRADARQTLAMESTTAVTTAAKVDLKAPELNRKALAALKQGNYSEAITLLKRVVELEPKDKAAWNNLGRAHMGLRQPDPAIAAFRQQIQVNPYDAHAHNWLGHALLEGRKYDDAEAAFRKQMELNPLDEYAPASLGRLLVERRRHAEALPFIEKAITLAPKDAQLHVQLGKAHLNLKRETDAIAAFDRALELSPAPGTWNNIAYELSLHGTQLDRALQYAESAVSAVTASARNFDLGRADRASYGVVSSLAAYWDTLGWVYFARGDMEKAEPLIQAAWLVAQHGEVADHLAQIYEKTGRRDAAIRTYAQALAAEDPADGTRDRLSRLLQDGKIDQLVAKHKDSLREVRTFVLGRVDAPGKSADVVILLSASRGVEGVRLVGGDAALTPLLDAVKRVVDHERMFPDATTPAKLLRRGTIECPQNDGYCTLSLLTADDAIPNR